jgi:predicted RNA binding protein YcfA (HicA-like mRNA interferase family)
VKQVSGRELARVVQQRGWQLARINGSHHIFTMAGRRERIVIPIHGNQR